MSHRSTTRSRRSHRAHRAHRAAVTVAAGAVVALPALAAVAFAAPAAATPTPSAVLANTFPVQCTANGASTVDGLLTVSAAGPASAAVGDTVTVSQYQVSLAVDSLPIDLTPFKGATATFAVDGTFQSHTVLSGAITLGPVASSGSVARATATSAGSVTLAGPADSSLAFPATAAGPVTVTTASPLLFDLNWYLTAVKAAANQPLPVGIPAADSGKLYGSSTLSCTGNPVLPWGTVQIVPAGTQTGTSGTLASTGTPTENLAVVGGWVLVAGVATTFLARRRPA